MSDFLKNHPLFQMLFCFLMIAVFFLSVGKPYVDSRDDAIVLEIEERVSTKIDTLVKINREILFTITE